jgi:hypothetical protein
VSNSKRNWAKFGVGVKQIVSRKWLIKHLLPPSSCKKQINKRNSYLLLAFLQSGSVPELDMHESKHFLPGPFVHSVYLWVLIFPLEDCLEFGNFVITLIDTSLCINIIINNAYCCQKQTEKSQTTACTVVWKVIYLSLVLRFSQFSGCWLILSVYIPMRFDFPFVRLFGVR